MSRLPTFAQSIETPACTRQTWFVVAVSCVLLGCSTQECQQTCAGGLPITGTLELSYNGFVGQFPRKGIAIQVVSANPDYTNMQGCGCAENRFWWAEFTVQMAASVSLPSQFNNLNQNSAWAYAFLMSCDTGSCTTDSRRRSWFEGPPDSTSAATGTLQAMDPIEGVFIADFTLTNTSIDSLESGSFQVHANFSWPTTYTQADAGP
jgi:hypothetical protein